MNINDNVEVTLTPYGRQILYAHWNRFCDTETTEKMIGYCHLSRDNYRFQLWVLMNIFGNSIDMGEKQVFEKNEIMIKEK